MILSIKPEQQESVQIDLSSALSTSILAHIPTAPLILDSPKTAAVNTSTTTRSALRITPTQSEDNCTALPGNGDPIIESALIDSREDVYPCNDQASLVSRLKRLTRILRVANPEKKYRQAAWERNQLYSAVMRLSDECRYLRQRVKFLETERVSRFVYT